LIFNSDAYFRLLAEKPSLAKSLSLGRKVIVSNQGINHGVNDESERGES